MGKKILSKVIIPVGTVWFLWILFRPLCESGGVMDYWKLLFLMGIPFGVHKMFFWLIPKGYGIGETIGILVLNLLIGGAIGTVILMWRMIVAVYTIISAMVSVLMRIFARSTMVVQ